MNNRLIASILLGFCVVAASSSARASDETEYMSKYEDSGTLKPFHRFVGELIEKYGSEDFGETVDFLKDYLKHLRELVKYPSSAHLYLKYDGETQFDNDGRCRLVNFVERFISLAEEPHLAEGYELDLVLNTIKIFFDADLRGVARGRCWHHNRLCKFLSANIKALVSANLERAVQTIMTRSAASQFDEFLEAFLSRDLEPGSTKDQLLAKMGELNLKSGRFDATAMLAELEKPKWGLRVDSEAKPSERLALGLKEMCRKFSGLYGSELELYTWAGLLNSDNLSDTQTPLKFYMLLEGWRLCLPVLHQYAYVLENIKRNKPTVSKRLLNMIKLRKN